VLGYATVAPQSTAFWSVSTDITLEVFPSLQATSSRLHATAQAIHTDARGCFATGRVVNDDGDLVALCSQAGAIRAAALVGSGSDPRLLRTVP
jgi:acyl-CoA thioesterase